MEDKSFELLSENGRRLLEEYRLCQNEKEIQSLIEKQKKLNESRGPQEIPNFDMTLEEFCEKYNCTKLDDIMKRYGF